MISSLSRVFSGWYSVLAGFSYLMRIFVQAADFLVKTTAHHQTGRWYFIEGCPNLNFCSVAGCPKLISGMPETHERCPNLTNKFSCWCKGVKGKFPVGYHLKNMYTQKELWCFMDAIPNDFQCMPWILWPRFVSLQYRRRLQCHARYCQSIWTRWVTLHICKLSFENRWFKRIRTHKKENT